jgi:hypothetical protein
MIVLDEHLLATDFQNAISRWYRGAVIHITDLRPGTLILDAAIPELLRSVRQPTFVTLNVKDFWRRSAPDRRFAIVGFAYPARRVFEIPSVLRALLQHPAFRTRRSRMGKVIRVSPEHVHYYSLDSWAIRELERP